MMSDPLDLCLEGDGLKSSDLDDPFSVLYRDIAPAQRYVKIKAGGADLSGGQPTACVVSGLPWWINDVELEKALAEKSISGVAMIRFYESAVNGKSKGAAFIKFHSSHSVQECVKNFDSYTDTYGSYTVIVKLLSPEAGLAFCGTGALPLLEQILNPPQPVQTVPVQPQQTTNASPISLTTLLQSRGTAADFDPKKADLIRQMQMQLSEASASGSFASLAGQLGGVKRGLPNPLQNLFDAKQRRVN
eukprot:TRINITY_DN17213_c0_g1_i1.p1 TRINITY_DN17213_c0_g1~~TRINITY_DN17213_c0_g1_i1.p1  ORF type:complete len:246 (+),score=49.65 TRINITY_DN17213_c0_g1_i1:39-776(+)